jgi:hypothetical protein
MNHLSFNMNIVSDAILVIVRFTMITFLHRFFLLVFAFFVFWSITTPSIASVSQLSLQDCQNMENKGVITANNPIPCQRLRRVSFHHLDFDGIPKTGNIIVIDFVAEEVEALFSELRNLKFPIKQSIPLEHYEGNDEASMSDNNTSSFNGRAVTGGTSWSKHAYGLAIDINPIQNPYLSFKSSGSAIILPPEAAQQFINRNENRPGKNNRQGLTEQVVNIFSNHGFLEWGGDWDSPIDYQHFQIGSTQFIQYLTSLPLNEATQQFNQYILSYRICLKENQALDVLHQRTLCTQRIKR